MLIDWSDEFDGWLDRLEARADAGEPIAGRTLELVTAQLQVLEDLDAEPKEESATLKRVRQSRTYEVWRVAHPYEPDLAVRLIVWFPPEADTVVVALFAGDKARMGDVFYNSVGPRADVAIRSYLQRTSIERGDASDE